MLHFARFFTSSISLNQLSEKVVEHQRMHYYSLPLFESPYLGLVWMNLVRLASSFPRNQHMFQIEIRVKAVFLSAQRKCFVTILENFQENFFIWIDVIIRIMRHQLLKIPRVIREDQKVVRVEHHVAVKNLKAPRQLKVWV